MRPVWHTKLASGILCQVANTSPEGTNRTSALLGHEVFAGSAETRFILMHDNSALEGHAGISYHAVLIPFDTVLRLH